MIHVGPWASKIHGYRPKQYVYKTVCLHTSLIVTFNEQLASTSQERLMSCTFSLRSDRTLGYRCPHAFITKRYLLLTSIIITITRIHFVLDIIDLYKLIAGDYHDTHL